MSTVIFDNTTPVQGISRATSVPDDSAFTWILCGFKAVTYADVMTIWTLETAAATLQADGNSGGSVSMGGVSEYWADGYTDWSLLAASATSATVCTPYMKRKDGAFTALATFNPANVTPTSVGFGMSTVHADEAGVFIVRSMMLYNIGLSASEVSNQLFSVKPRRWTNLVFWNAALDAGNPQTDQSGTGGNFTTTGTPTASQDDPGIPWQRSRTYGYA